MSECEFDVAFKRLNDQLFSPLKEKADYALTPQETEILIQAFRSSVFVEYLFCSLEEDDDARALLEKQVRTAYELKQEKVVH